MSTARLFRIKAAQNQLIALLGGIDGALALEVGNAARSTIGRWSDTNDPTIMPLMTVLAYEAAAKQPVVTAAMAELNNRKLADASAVAAMGIMERHAGAIMQASELMSLGATAFADGKVTPNEATGLDRAAAALENAISAYRQVLAGVRAEGGFKIVGSAS